MGKFAAGYGAEQERLQELLLYAYAHPSCRPIERALNTTFHGHLGLNWQALLVFNLLLFLTSTLLHI